MTPSSATLVSSTILLFLGIIAVGLGGTGLGVYREGPPSKLHVYHSVVDAGIGVLAGALALAVVTVVLLVRGL